MTVSPPVHPADPTEIHRRLEVAVEAAREAGDLVLRRFRRPDLAVEWKSDASPVTIADREAEAHLRRSLEAAFPRDGILGEELGETTGTSGYRWILDPVDGTRSFVRGIPLFGTLVAVERDGRGVVGVIHLPACGETVYAATGEGAWWKVGEDEPRPARVSSVPTLDEALFLVTSPEGFARRGCQEAFERLRARCGSTRTWGDCYGYALVATGRAEVMVDPALRVWDAAALQPILEEAGGTFTGWSGEASIHAGDGFATNGQLYPAVLAVLHGAGG